MFSLEGLQSIVTFNYSQVSKLETPQALPFGDAHFVIGIKDHRTDHIPWVIRVKNEQGYYVTIRTGYFFQGVYNQLESYNESKGKYQVQPSLVLSASFLLVCETLDDLETIGL